MGPVHDLVLVARRHHARIGNCGVTFAPCRSDDHGYLAEMMESVEDIPAETILDGLAWDWETLPEYLDSIERLRPRSTSAVSSVTRALRYQVMGERVLDEDAERTGDDLARDARASSPRSMAAGARSATRRRGSSCTWCPTVARCPGTYAPPTSTSPSPTA